MTRKALGKGLSALLKDRESTEESALQEIDLDLLRPNPYQPRQVFDPDKLDELARSIQSHGLVQPIVARPIGGRYEIIAGERRWRAAQKLGLSSVPVLLKQVSDEHLLETSLIENIQRENLNPMEEARAYQRLAEELQLTQEQVAQRTGKERSTVANFMRLLRLPDDLQRWVEEEKLSMGHARALLALPSHEEQRQLADKIWRKGWSVRETERRVNQSRRPVRPSVTPLEDPNVRDAVHRLESALGSRVRIHSKGKGGRIEIEYSSPEELQRLYEYLIRNP
ncbi:MAG: ParB/RepB/Spo0J family partition protein [Acidobacteriota bacterium]